MKKVLYIFIALCSSSLLKCQTISGDSLIWENSDKSWTQLMDDLFESFNDSTLLPLNVLAEKSTFLISADSIMGQDIALGAVQLMTLEKLEELYLHVIQLNERIKVLEAENVSYQKDY